MSAARRAHAAACACSGVLAPSSQAEYGIQAYNSAPLALHSPLSTKIGSRGTRPILRSGRDGAEPRVSGWLRFLGLHAGGQLRSAGGSRLARAVSCQAQAGSCQAFDLCSCGGQRAAHQPCFSTMGPCHVMCPLSMVSSATWRRSGSGRGGVSVQGRRAQG